MISVVISLKAAVTLTFIIYLCKLHSVTAIEEELSDNDFLEKYDEVAIKVACEAMSASDPELYKLNISRAVTYQDVTKLTFLNKGLQLNTRMIEFPDDIAWKRRLVNSMFTIWFNSCPDTYVNHGYMKIMRELIMIYLNSLEVRSTESMDVWEAITNTLVTCGQRETTIYNFTHIGYSVNGLIIDAPNDETPSPVSTSGSNSPQPKGDSNSSNAGVAGKVLNEKSQMLAGRMDPIPNMVGEEDGFVLESDEEGEATEAPTDTGDGGDDADGGGDTPEPAEPPPPPPSPPPAPSPSSTGPVTGEKHLFNLVPQADAASSVYQLDIVIENLWSVFSHAWARCYPEAPSRQLWGPRFKQLFFRDILEPLEERWKDPGPLSYYLDLIMGDYDVQLIQHNALYCVDAGYFTTGAGIFELVRPVKLTDISEGANAFQNHQIN